MSVDTAETRTLSEAATRIRTVEAVVNPLSGSVGPDAIGELEQILSEYGLKARIQSLEDADFEAVISSAVDAGPDLLIVLAGDGTACAAASRCGPEGPLVAPLAGGTMNMLPHALYGPKSWQEGLRDTLETGVVRPVSGGSVDGHYFYVAAILGAPALWARAREAVREGNLKRAVAWGRNAWRRAFCRTLRFRLDGGGAHKADALTLLCPLVSKAMDDKDKALEAAAIDPRGAADAFRLALRTAAAEITERFDWRSDASVETTRCRSGVAWAPGAIPGLCDGETIKLGRTARIEFRDTAFRALAPPVKHTPPAVGGIAD
jgi:diacylglycerol kinase family enzyme